MCGTLEVVSHEATAWHFVVCLRESAVMAAVMPVAVREGLREFTLAASMCWTAASTV